MAKENKEIDYVAESIWMEDVNKRHNKDAALYKFYQLNPYTKKSFHFVTGKVGERREKICLSQMPGYGDIHDSIWRPYVGPQLKKCVPQTEGQRYGWFPQGTGHSDPENYDERFNFSHSTPTFIKVQEQIRAYDKLMKELTESKNKVLAFAEP